MQNILSKYRVSCSMLSRGLFTWFDQVLGLIYCRERYAHVWFLVTVQAVTNVLHLVNSSVDALSAGE